MTANGPEAELHELSSDARALLNAVTAIGSDLDLHNVLDRIVASACTLTGARYGALGVVGATGMLTDFVTHGLDDESRAAIGALPRGHGILGLLIRHPTPIRLPRLQDHEASYGFPANHPPMTTFLGVPILVRGTVFGNLYLTDKAGGVPFTAGDETLVEALARAAGFVIDNARAYAVSERQRAWLEAAARLSDSLGPGMGVPEALHQVALATRTASGAEAVGVLFADQAGAPELVASDGRAASQLEALLPEIDTEAMSIDGEAVRLLQDDGRTVQVLPLRTHLHGRFCVVVLTTGSTDDPALHSLELDLVSSFVDQAGLALDRLQSALDREELAIVSDRDRIARDLHDLVIQRLFATGIHLQGIRSQVSSPTVLERLDGAVADLDNTIRDIRSSIFELQQPDRPTIRTAVRKLAEEYAPVLGFAPVVRTIGPVDTAVSEQVAQHVFAVLREGLSNVARHADATYAVVELQAESGWLVLRVSDNGVGPGEMSRESGLRNIRERAVQLGGAVQLSKREPSGTLLEWRVPFGAL